MRTISKHCVLASEAEVLAAVADHPSIAVHPYLLVDAHHSYSDLSVFPELIQQGRLLGLEGERGQSGGGAVEERS